MQSGQLRPLGPENEGAFGSNADFPSFSPSVPFDISLWAKAQSGLLILVTEFIITKSAS